MDRDNTPTEAAQVDPFSMEQAYKTYQHNIRRSEELIYEITKGAKGDVSEHDLLLMAVEAIARMNHKTVLRTVVEPALAARSAGKPPADSPTPD